MKRAATSYIRSWITPATSYTPGLSRITDGSVIRLDWNESPFPLTPRAREVLSSFTDGNRYPDFTQAPLREALAAYVHTTPERIITGAGMDDVFKAVCNLFLEPGDAIIISDPTFGVYRSLAALYGCELINVPLGPAPDFALDVNGLIAAVTDRTKMLVICNPNNPTGHVFSRDDIVRVIESVDCPVILDEAYAEFAGVDHTSLTDAYSNVIVMRTMSKFAALAGMRVGYAIFPETLCLYLPKIQPEFGNTSELAARIAIASLQDLPILERQRDEIIAERERVTAALNGIKGVIAYPSSTNFVLASLPVDDSTPILEAFVEAGIYVRRPANPGLEHTLRISIGQREENDAVLAHLPGFLSANVAEGPVS